MTTARSGRRVRLVLALLTSAGLALGPVPVAAAAAQPAGTYADSPYSADLHATPTRTENQSKLWFSADAWWAVMLEPTGLTARIFELMPDHTWRPTSAVVNGDVLDIGDTLHEGDSVHVLTRQKDESLYDVLLTFDPAARDYRVVASHLVTTRGSATPAAMARDSTGRLWVGFASSTTVVVTSSTDNGATWSGFHELAPTGTGTTPEAAALVAYDDRIGILWSDQKAGSFEFASHHDGDDPHTWVREQALVGPAEADNHISLARIDGDPSDTLVAAVKTSENEVGQPLDSPLIEVLVRKPGGQWSATPVGTIGDQLNNPVLQVDPVTRTLHVFAAGHGDIVTKRASLDDIRFAPGLGDLVLSGGRGVLADPAVSKDPVDVRSGILVLASDTDNHVYRHAEVPIVPAAPVADPDDHTPPTAPGGVQGHVASGGTVVLSWTPATDGDRWVPGRQGVPVRDYVVQRDGVDVATVDSTSFVDQLHDVPAGTSLQYDVVAVDFAGNRSDPVRVTVDLPAAEPNTLPLAIGIGLLLVTLLGGGVALWRYRVARALTAAQRDDAVSARVHTPPEPSRR